MRESEYQARVIRKLYERFEGCFIIKNDSGYIQGIPDLMMLHHDFWAVLEVKRDHHAPHQANQDYYIDMFDHMSFAAYIYPENEEEVLDAIQRAFESRRKTRVSKR